jgi:hypothetical protein
MTTTATQALTPSVTNLGLLKPLDKWKVGTVNTQGAPYCAMVNQFDRQVVLAFARNGQGLGSVAMDFREPFFKEGAEYPVTLKVDGEKLRKLTGRASNNRSVVVQIGEDEHLYTAFNNNGGMQVGLPDIKVSFALDKFSNSYTSLVDCSAGLGPKTVALPVGSVEKNALAPIDEEVAKIGKEDTLAALTSKEVDILDAQLNEKSSQEEDKSQQKLEALETLQSGLNKQLDQQKSRIAELERAKEISDRKLLASAETVAPVKAPVATGKSSAQLLEQQQNKQLEQQQTNKIVDGLSKSEKTLAARVAQLQHERDGLQAQLESQRKLAAETHAKETTDIAATSAKTVDENKSLKAELAGKQAQLAAAVKLQNQNAAERDSLKKQLDSALAFNTDVQPDVKKMLEEKVAIEGKLNAVKQEKQEIAARLESQEKQTKLLQAALIEKEKTLAEKEKTVSAQNGSSDDADKKLGAVQAELASLKNEHTAQTARLQTQLDEKTAQFSALNRRFEEQGKIIAGKGDSIQPQDKIALELVSKKADVSRLETMLASVETQRKTEAERAGKIQAELDQTRVQLSDMKKLLADSGVRDKDLSTTKAALEQSNLRIQEMQAQLKASQAGQAQVQAQAVSAVKTETEENLKKAQLEISRLKVEKIALEQKLEQNIAKVAEQNIAKVSEQNIAKVAEQTIPKNTAQQLDALAPASGTVLAQPVLAQPAMEKKSAVVEKTAIVEPVISPAVVKAEKDIPVAALAEPLADKPVSDDAFFVPAVPKAPVDRQELASVKEVPVTPSPEKTVAPAKAATKAEMLDSESSNQAAAFLDNIMAYHRPGRTQVVADKKKSAVSPAVVAVKKSIVKSVPVDTDVADIQPASGTPEEKPEEKMGQAWEKAPSVQNEPAEDAPSAMASLTVEELLKTSGLTVSNFAPASQNKDETVSKWTLDNMNGMFETAAVHSSFEGQVQEYLSRYRDDCGQPLTVHLQPAQKTSSGVLAKADIECPTASNLYVTSFLFLQDAGGFSTILHTGYPEDKAKLIALRDNMADALEKSQGLVLPQQTVAAPQTAPKKAHAESKHAEELPPLLETTPVASFKLDVPKTASKISQGTVPETTPETIIVQ